MLNGSTHTHAHTHRAALARKAILHLHAKGQIPPWPPETLTLCLLALRESVLPLTESDLCSGIPAKVLHKIFQL